MSPLRAAGSPAPFWRVLADLVFPVRCAGCRAELECASGQLCPSCVMALAAGCMRVPAPRVPVPVWAAANYAGQARSAILELKERGRRSVADDLGVALADCITAACPQFRGPRTLVPVPSRWRARRARGIDTTALLAGRAAAALRQRGVVASVVPALVIRRPVDDQAGLSAARRSANVAGAFAVRERAAGLMRQAAVSGRLIVIDDVTTTGATLAEACRALTAAGACPAATAVVAATVRRSRELAGRDAVRLSPG